MHRGVSYYRYGWNAWHKGRACEGDVPYRVDEEYARKSWLKGYKDARQVTRLTGESGAFWGRVYIPQPMLVKFGLAVVVFGLAVVVTVAIYSVNA